MWEPAQRYPDPSIRTLDARFEKYHLLSTKIERIATGFRWAEGPVWFGDRRQLLWSDVPNDRIMRWDEISGAVHTFRAPSQHANGNTRDRQGRLLTCEHRARRLTRTEHDGQLTVLADSFDGKRLNSPNDVVVTTDGAIWFTDPPFGIVGHYQGEPARQELPANLYRIDPVSGALKVMAGDIQGPNGLAFSPDERQLYVIESRARPRNILVFEVLAGGTQLSAGRVLTDAGDGTPDGLRVDVDGNLWCGWGMGTDELDGVRVFAPDGSAIGHIALPERCANLCFGGLQRNRLFMASSTSIYSLYVNTQGVAGG